MDVPTLEQLIAVRRFPPVAHPRHAREVLAGAGEEALAAWTAGYAVTLPEHRQLLEDLLGALAWGETGMAVLINGLYGTGKSHFLVLLHLLAALPAAWTPFLDAHPEYRRYVLPMQAHRRVVLHFSLDEYSPRHALEDALAREMTRTLAEAGIDVPAAWTTGGSRLDAWSALLAACRDAGYDGIVLLVDELSLFLAGKSPARREADAALLQFLAGWTANTPVWLVGALQRNLADVGALRTHSWRQVEDRFRRYTLSPQEIARVLRDKLLTRTDPAAARALIATRIIPAAEAHHLALSAGDLQQHWPFHPAALDLFMTAANGYLSPHRSAVELLQRLGEAARLARPANRLITAHDLFTLAADDLRGQQRLARCWDVVDLLHGRTEDALAHRAIDLLALLHLAERALPLTQVRALLFDGVDAPDLDTLSATLHALRRRGPHLAVARDADPAREVFSLAIDDETGVLAGLRMQEMRQECTADDPRIVELALRACTDAAWPLAHALEGLKTAVPWCGSERATQVILAPALTRELIVRQYEGLMAGKAEACALLGWPGTATADCWHAASALLDGPPTAAFLYWQPRAPRTGERELWAEYAAWQRAATEALPPATPRDRRVRARCVERADELRAAVAATVCALFREGCWVNARGAEGTPAPDAGLIGCLAGMLAPGFDALYPAFPRCAPGGVPSRTVTQQLLAHFIEPGEIHLDPQALLAEYLDRFLLPLGCAEILGTTARLAPPRGEILAPLLALTAAGPARLTDAIARLGCPPLGLTMEQARLVVFAAVRVGALQPLDGFLQPLDPDETSLARSDALVFLAAPTPASARHRPLLLALAGAWEIAVEPWPVACSQLERRLRAWLKTWTPRMPALCEMLDAWSAATGAAPWAWAASQRALTSLAHAAGLDAPTFNALLDALGTEFSPVPIEALDEAAAWWRTHGDRLRLLRQWAPDAMRAELASVEEALTRGEESFPRLAELGERVDNLHAAYCDAYRRRHDAVFGAVAVATLRAAFELPAFRAVKLLARLPLTQPEPAQRCMLALAQARMTYCPGDFTRLSEEGRCARCGLTLDSPSPLPDAGQVREWAEAALPAYAELLADDPWCADVRHRLPRAPEALATRAATVLNWQPATGLPALLDALDDRLLTWLLRDTPPAGKRRVDALGARLHGHDLTLAEARDTLLDWLDPDRTLGDDALLSFE